MQNTNDKVYRTFAEKFASLERLPGYLTVEEAAAVIGVSKSSIYHYIASGKLPGARFGPIIAVSEEDARLQSRKRAHKTAIEPL